MSAYDQLPTDPLVFVSCIQSMGNLQPQYEVGVNKTDPLPFKCTDVLNEYYRRGYSVASHSLVHEAPGLVSEGYFVGTWTMTKPIDQCSAVTQYTILSRV